MNYNIYRCPDPVATKTNEPWYPTTNICPCDPNLSNQTGRGFTTCPYGIETDNTTNNGVKQNIKGITLNNTLGNLYNDQQYIPPQYDPRPSSRIGIQWRSASN